MKGKLISNSRIVYEENGFRKYIDILPDTDKTGLEFGMEVEFELVHKLRPQATYTSEEGWSETPIDGIFAKLIDQWDEVEEEYMKDEYPVFGGSFTNALTPWEWLKRYYHPPVRKK